MTNIPQGTHPVLPEPLIPVNRKQAPCYNKIRSQFTCSDPGSAHWRNPQETSCLRPQALTQRQKRLPKPHHLPIIQTYTYPRLPKEQTPPEESDTQFEDCRIKRLKLFGQATKERKNTVHDLRGVHTAQSRVRKRVQNCLQIKI